MNNELFSHDLVEESTYNLLVIEGDAIFFDKKTDVEQFIITYTALESIKINNLSIRENIVFVNDDEYKLKDIYLYLNHVSYINRATTNQNTLAYFLKKQNLNIPEFIYLYDLP